MAEENSRQIAVPQFDNNSKKNLADLDFASAAAAFSRQPHRFGEPWPAATASARSPHQYFWCCARLRISATGGRRPGWTSYNSAMGCDSSVYGPFSISGRPFQPHAAVRRMSGG